jgi:hypothetical protein
MTVRLLGESDRTAAFAYMCAFNFESAFTVNFYRLIDCAVGAIVIEARRPVPDDDIDMRAAPLASLDGPRCALKGRSILCNAKNENQTQGQSFCLLIGVGHIYMRARPAKIISADRFGYIGLSSRTAAVARKNWYLIRRRSHHDVTIIQP